MSIEAIWQRYDADEARLSAPLSARMLELALLKPGQRVLDLATGRGEPAITAAKRVGPAGMVVGLDIVPTMLAMARQRAALEGVSNLELIGADAQLPIIHAAVPFDAVLARWGLMYMSDPVAALRSAWNATAPEARLVAALWAEPERVDYYTLPRRILETYTAIAAIDFSRPGTFRLASLPVIERDFAAASWQIEHIEELYVEVMEAHSAAQLIDWCRCFGMSRLLEPLPQEIQQRWEQDLVAACQPPNGSSMVRLGGITRIVTARKPPELNQP